jgi:hypothetical protein
MEVAGAGDAAVWVPAVAGDEAVEQEGLEGGAGGGEGTGGFRKVSGGEKAAGSDVEDEDASVGV